VAIAPLKYTIPPKLPTAAFLVPNGAFVHPFCNVKAVNEIFFAADESALGPTHPPQLSGFPVATPSGPFENTPYFAPVPFTPMPAGPVAEPPTP
jgi:hypothetical protein